MQLELTGAPGPCPRGAFQGMKGALTRSQAVVILAVWPWTESRNILGPVSFSVKYWPSRPNIFWLYNYRCIETSLFCSLWNGYKCCLYPKHMGLNSPPNSFVHFATVTSSKILNSVTWINSFFVLCSPPLTPHIIAHCAWVFSYDFPPILELCVPLSNAKWEPLITITVAIFHPSHGYPSSPAVM